MAARAPKVQKVMVQPIVSQMSESFWEIYYSFLTRHVSNFFLSQNLIFRYLQTRSRVDIWLYENINMHMEGHIVGFDEYMNIVLDDAEEVYVKTNTRKQIGISLIHLSCEIFLQFLSLRSSIVERWQHNPYSECCQRWRLIVYKHTFEAFHHLARIHPPKRAVAYYLYYLGKFLYIDWLSWYKNQLKCHPSII